MDYGIGKALTVLFIFTAISIIPTLYCVIKIIEWIINHIKIV